MQRLHRLLDRYRLIVPVDLEHVDIGGVEAAQGGFDGVEDPLARQPALVDVVDGPIDVLEGERFGVVALARRSTAFGQDDEFVSGEVVFFDGFADNFFGGAVAVDVGGVPLLYAPFERLDVQGGWS